jgi:uncharacterized iron-regulated membrane protein
MHVLLRRVHLLLAMVLGLILAVVCLSGTGAAFRPEIERWAAGVDVGAAAVPLAGPALAPAAIASGAGTATGAAVVALAIPASGPLAWTVRGPASAAWVVFTDPGNGAVMGQTRDSRIAAAVAWLAGFHHHLWLGAVGDAVVGTTGLALLLFSATGLALWWRARGRWRTDLRLGSHRSWHHVAGLVAMPVLVLVAITGAAFAFGWMRSLLHTGLGGTSADASFAMLPPDQRPVSGPRTGSGTTLAQAIAAASSAVPDGRVHLVSWPRGADPKGVWRVALEVPGSTSTKGGAIALIDRWSGAVLAVQDPRTMSLGGWVINQHWSLHLGQYAGLTSRVVHALAGLLPAVLLVTGVALWWRRTRGRREP